MTKAGVIKNVKNRKLIIMILKSIQQNILFLFILFTSILNAQDLESRFNSANQAYADEDYQQAIELYSGILEEGVESGEVFFNLGNAYYKINDLGRAILYYEKAKKYIEGDPALEQNLKLAQLRIVDKIEPIPKLFIIDWWDQLIHIFSLDIWLWLCLGIFFILTLLIAGLLLYSRRVIYKLIWATSFLFILILIITLSVVYEFETTKFGVILDEKVSVVSEPDIDGTEIFILHEGTKVKINRNLDSWLEVSIPDGKIGWLKQTSLEVI
jgi:tetratricopeptide (TPR) repeat protein